MNEEEKMKKALSESLEYRIQAEVAMIHNRFRLKAVLQTQGATTWQREVPIYSLLLVIARPNQPFVQLVEAGDHAITQHNFLIPWQSIQ